MQELTAKQQQVYEYMLSHYHEYGYAPSVREICTAVGLSSPSTVHGHLSRLEEKGYIRRNESKSRAIEFCFENTAATVLPLVGSVAAGEPILASSNIVAYYPIPQDINASTDDGAFLLEVRGNSMINAGILPMDILVVNPSFRVQDGDIGIALVNDEEATVKRIYKHGEEFELRPENDTLSSKFIKKKQVRIVGKVVGLIRTQIV